MNNPNFEQNIGFDTWMSIMRVHKIILQRLAANMARFDDLSLAQFDVLVHLLHEEGISQQELTDKMLVTKRNVTGLIDRMSERGWVERKADPNDRRANLLYLTTKGKELIRQVLPSHRAKIIETMNLLSEEEQQILLDLMGKFQNLLQTP